MEITKQKYRNSEHDLSYFGSDDTKFMHEYNRKDMTVCNIDGVQYKHNVSGIKRIRFRESKHMNESVSSYQLDLLRELAKDFKILNELDKTTKREIFIIRGDFPYERVKIVNLISGEYYELNQKQFIDFGNFELELD